MFGELQKRYGKKVLGKLAVGPEKVPDSRSVDQNEKRKTHCRAVQKGGEMRLLCERSPAKIRLVGGSRKTFLSIGTNIGASKMRKSLRGRRASRRA